MSLKETNSSETPTFNFPSSQTTIKLPCLWFRWLILALLTLLGYAYGQYDQLKNQQSIYKNKIETNSNALLQVSDLSAKVNRRAVDIAEIKRDVSTLQKDVSSLTEALKDQGKDIKELLQRTPQTPR